jgi:phenylacetic acid degradation operon negative regulatory protein
VTSPFEIEEIYPDDAAAMVRLPRRQSGSAPQGLAVTLLADYTLQSRAWLPSAAIVALLVESGVTPAGARTAISRLARRDVLEGSQQGRNRSYRLTLPVANHLSVGGRWVVSSALPASWDGSWTLIAFSLPQEEGTQRRSLRGQLRWLGFAPLYDGLWVSPHGFTSRARTELGDVRFSGVTVFRAQHVGVAATIGRDPIGAWDVAAIASCYETFLRRWRPLASRIRKGRVSGVEAVQARTEVMDTYRTFPLLDPQLPLELLPAGWLREPAREVFVAVYDGLAEAAQAHVRAVAARFGGDEHDIRAHTTADLVAGVRLVGSSG